MLFEKAIFTFRKSNFQKFFLSESVFTYFFILLAYSLFRKSFTQRTVLSVLLNVKNCPLIFYRLRHSL